MIYPLDKIKPIAQDGQAVLMRLPWWIRPRHFMTSHYTYPCDGEDGMVTEILWKTPYRRDRLLVGDWRRAGRRENWQGDQNEFIRGVNASAKT